MSDTNKLITSITGIPDSSELGKAIFKQVKKLPMAVRDYLHAKKASNQREPKRNNYQSLDAYLAAYNDWHIHVPYASRVLNSADLTTFGEFKSRITNELAQLRGPNDAPFSTEDIILSCLAIHEANDREGAEDLIKTEFSKLIPQVKAYLRAHAQHYVACPPMPKLGERSSTEELQAFKTWTQARPACTLNQLECVSKNEFVHRFVDEHELTLKFGIPRLERPRFVWEVVSKEA